MGAGRRHGAARGRCTTRTVGALIGLALAAAPPAASIAAAHTAPRIPVTETALFTFHSDLATNVNDALIAAGAARSKGTAGDLPRGRRIDLLWAAAGGALARVGACGRQTTPKRSLQAGVLRRR